MNTNVNDKSFFSQKEEEVLEFWQKNNLFKKSVQNPAGLESPKGDYVFYDGPPFITGLPHYATLLPSIAKDVIPRYWTMKGYRVERVWGWDCHGLPAENKVEEQLNLKNKKDIEKLGIGKFVDACRNYVDVGVEQWQWYIDRIGRWVDMENAYKTMDLKFMESVLWAFKELYEAEYIYEGYRTSLHCPRCATPLSKFEVTMDAGSYKEVEDQAITVKFKLKDEETYLLAWTTTPWTLPGNMALAVGKDIDYVKFKDTDSGNIYILAKDKLEEILEEQNYEVLEEFEGKDLLSKEYEPLFDLKNVKIKQNENTFKIYPGEFVNTEEGTGIVHIAPNFGEDDFKLGQDNDLPQVELMDENGIYTKEAGPEWQDLYFEEANKKAIERLKDKIFNSQVYKHNYPHCYRCGTPLIYKTQKAWYFNVESIREKLIQSNEDINWVPDHFKEGRFKYNLENAPDWSLSRTRYWGSPVPVWRCETCSELKVPGSIKEIEELSGEKVEDLHRPNIDKFEFKCSCGGAMKRVPEVLDCWFESGSMPFAQFHYPFERTEDWPNLFPADFIIEYTGQLRGWFYYLHVLSNALFDSLCFKNVIVTGVLSGTDGRKMSKSYGNYPDPRATLDKYGSDALRMYFMASPIMTGGDMNLSERDLEDSLRKNVILLRNVLKFYSLFSAEGEFKDNGEKFSNPGSKNILDKWIVSRLNELIQEVSHNLENYNLPGATRPVTKFIGDLSTWYLRRSRDRFKSETKEDKQMAIQTTGYVLLRFSRTIAPLMPFLAEELWQQVTGNNFGSGGKSVHLEAFPKAGEVDKEIVAEMEKVREIVELGLSRRDEAGIKVRQPLNQFSIFNFQFSNQDFEKLIKDELNVKNVQCQAGKGEIKVELDTEITRDLRLEGIKREIIRLVNARRKKQGLTLKDSIEIYWESEDEEIKEALGKYEQDILKDTLAGSLESGLKEEIEIKESKVNEGIIKLGIKKK